VTCEELLELILDYVGGELVIEQRQTVEIHLAGCQNCTIRIETYRHTVRLARALPKCGPLPAAVEERLRKVLEPHLSSGEPGA
jgi:anti-sigma factor RsiW